MLHLCLIQLLEMLFQEQSQLKFRRVEEQAKKKIIYIYTQNIYLHKLYMKGYLEFWKLLIFLQEQMLLNNLYLLSLLFITTWEEFQQIIKGKLLQLIKMEKIKQFKDYLQLESVNVLVYMELIDQEQIHYQIYLYLEDLLQKQQNK